MSARRFFPAIAFGFGLAIAPPAAAQLRPLEPIDFRSFDGAPVRVQIGVGKYADQYASLAGTRGTLWEVGDVRITIRSGRMIMELGGTLQRRFKDEHVVAEPFGDARAAPDGKRVDAGDYRVSTVLRLTDAQSPLLATLRFGTRLPTTDNRVGLDRDVTDFFATIAARRAVGSVSLSAEGGLSINGTRQSTYEQSDVLVYALGATWQNAWISPSVVILGQQDFHDWAIRGNEDLAEMRAGVRVGNRHWLSAVLVHGLTSSSPSHGLQISLGASFFGPR